MSRRTATAALAAVLLLAGCSSGDGNGKGDEPDTQPSSSDRSDSSAPGGQGDAPPAKGSVEVVETVAEGLKSPWGMVVLPEGDLLVASRDEGTVTHVAAEGGKKTQVGEVPGVKAGGEGGLLGLAMGDDNQLYAYFTSDSDNRIVRMLYDKDKPAGQQLRAPDVVYRGLEKDQNHNGGRIAFGPDGMLYVGTGERYHPDLAQDKDKPNGKILRMTPDGKPAKGNPKADSVVYSYGHRNVQGLAWDGEKRLWASEFGQDTWDELNHIQPGKNYGWPVVEGKSEDKRYTNPLEQWSTADASPSGLAYSKGSLWMAGLRGTRLWRVPLDGTKAVAEPQAFLEREYGRLRTVVALENGDLLVTTSNTDGRGDVRDGDDRILRLKVS
ncbi:PQQ-dependent sugar dehydrogenase [Streptomyces sp. A7024]|uniref:PQQ-dependent sugar dehydrogenase n=1 Tax=Streptomyces coryli TaxID=1128680 RepID=A0A6G4TX52_9ACTN|nr:PQQ-dependent sugar dehydrogenase [Streptomyces coryli]NGN64026.1 PQQ-dependent sugar dehydrogenase [Streptomyces coryli]